MGWWLLHHDPQKKRGNISKLRDEAKWRKLKLGQNKPKPLESARVPERGMLHWQYYPTKEHKIAHTLPWPLRKEKPRSFPLFIYSHCSSPEIPAGLLRRPRNNHTGRVEGLWGKARSRKEAEHHYNHCNCDRMVFLWNSCCYTAEVLQTCSACVEW